MTFLNEGNRNFPPTIDNKGNEDTGPDAIGSKDIVIVGAGAIMKAEIRNCRYIEIGGHYEGDLFADMVLIQQGGRINGNVHSDNAEIHGSLYGEADIKNLIDIRESGSVVGNIKYGQLAIAVGGNLSGELTNVPPALSGDLDLTVDIGRSVAITTADLTAIDPDDSATDLVFSVSNQTNGMVVMSSAPNQSLESFTQQELENGKVLFVHDGSESSKASFDVVVKDSEGANSGNPKTVRVTVNR